MDRPRVNDGIHGLLRYNPEMIEDLKKDRESFIRRYPISRIEIDLAPITDKRWNGKKESEKCNSCDVSQAGYKTEIICRGCSELEKNKLT